MDEELAESWEEAADSGVKKKNTHTRNTPSAAGEAPSGGFSTFTWSLFSEFLASFVPGPRLRRANNVAEAS